MLIPLEKIVKKYNIKFDGILHVGAHECEELSAYEQYLPRNKILWIEAMPEKVLQNHQKYSNLLIHNAVVSDTIENVKFYISNNGQSSSMLELGLHKTFYPSIKYTHYFETQTKLLSDIISTYNIKYNFLNLDIQGAELKALKGMETFLPNVDYIYTEVNSDYVYKNCALITEIDEYLLKFGLHRVETEWAGNARWGDALYIRK